MNSLSLARDDLRKARARRRALQVLYEEESYDDVVREAQEMVELILKGARRYIGIDPPKRHDVGATLRAHQDHLPDAWRKKSQFFARILERLKKRLEELGAERRTDPDGYTYWVLK